ncbi:aminopeptidase, partial [bacterium]|nr:aminopeptidase [bacterium]
TAYSTLGWFSDPIFTPMLRNPDEYLANVILHELAHATVFIKSDADFNENLATFVGNQGSIDYFVARFGPDDPRARFARDDAEDDASFSREIGDLRARLTKVYETGKPREEKLLEKAAVFRDFRARYRAEIRPRLRRGGFDRLVESPSFNNAAILGLDRYHADTATFEAAHRKLGSSLKATIEKLREIARSPTPRAVLEAFVKA